MKNKLLVEFLATAAIAAAAFAARPLVRAAAAQNNGELGYSYLRLVIDGKTMQNIGRKQEYRGWLMLHAIDARAFPHEIHPPTEKYHPAGWTSLDKFLRDGPKRSGELGFGVGDDGGLDPMLEAVKLKAVIPEADLDYYDFLANVFVGKHRLTGVRILSVQDMPASACAMYDVRIRFASITAR